MIVISIILIALGVLFLAFGLAIWCFKKYNLVNGYNDIKKPNQEVKNYVRNIGIIETAVGSIWVILGTISIFNENYIFIFFGVCLATLLIPLVINQIIASKNSK